ncbi:MAG TPA: hypothetical protein VFX28_11160, partial [Methylomirabilota bacterium]|nr:hypothetical protein [Methylomirabilota bacterium]
VALAVVLGAVIAASARNARTAVLGLVLVMVGGAFVADPLPGSLGLAARLVGSVLGGYLLWIAARGTDARTGGSRLGWPAELLVAAAAAVVGYGSHGLGAPGAGPAVAQAAGFALAALAVAPLLNGGDILRLGVGLNLLLTGAILARTTLGGTPDTLEQLAIAGLVAVLGGVVAIAAATARADGIGGFDFGPAAGERRRRPPDAHPLEPR